MNFFDELKNKLEGKQVSIVFPEGHDIRILKACLELSKTTYVKPIVLGDRERINQVAKENQLDISNLELLDGITYPELDHLVELFVERRKGKVTPEEARQLLIENRNYFGTLLVFANKAEGLVSGADGSTADTIRPALQIVKMKPGLTKASGMMFLIKEDVRLYMADCAININPTAQELAEIALVSEQTVRQFNDQPKIAMLSFSTKGSAKSEEQEKVALATALAQEQKPGIELDGELQFDAAFVPTVGQKKAPNSLVAGYANTFVFPTLDAGNIGYKIAQRLGGFEAVGPVLQGLAKPINDLSRGASTEDVYNLALITAVQSLSE